MNAGANEYEDLEVDSFPTLAIFKGGVKDPVNKLNTPAVFDESYESINELYNFLRKNTFKEFPKIQKYEEESDEKKGDL